MFDEDAGDLQQMRLIVWRVLRRVAAISEDSPPAELLRCAHCLAQLSSAYVKLIEAGDFEVRLKALESYR